VHRKKSMFKVRNHQASTGRDQRSQIFIFYIFTIISGYIQSISEIFLNHQSEKKRETFEFEEKVIKERKMTSRPPTLFDALKKKDVEKVAKLVEEGADLNASGTHEESVLFKAIQLGDPQIFDILMSKTNGKKKKIDVNKKNPVTEFSPLHHAVKHKNDHAVIELLKCAEIKVNERNKEGNTPLHLAIDNGNEEAVLHLAFNDKTQYDVINNNNLTAVQVNTGDSNSTPARNFLIECMKQSKDQLIAGTKLKCFSMETVDHLLQKARDENLKGSSDVQFETNIMQRVSVHNSTMKDLYISGSTVGESSGIVMPPETTSAAQSTGTQANPSSGYQTPNQPSHPQCSGRPGTQPSSGSQTNHTPVVNLNNSTVGRGVHVAKGDRNQTVYNYGGQTSHQQPSNNPDPVNRERPPHTEVPIDDHNPSTPPRSQNTTEHPTGYHTTQPPHSAGYQSTQPRPQQHQSAKANTQPNQHPRTFAPPDQRPQPTTDNPMQDTSSPRNYQSIYQTDNPSELDHKTPKITNAAMPDINRLSINQMRQSTNTDSPSLSNNQQQTVHPFDDLTGSLPPTRTTTTTNTLPNMGSLPTENTPRNSTDQLPSSSNVPNNQLGARDSSRAPSENTDTQATFRQKPQDSFAGI
uniref:Uncharacterized protein n=2 Tax=Clytia hemisphaerica TaxID=252671 RepID=A0A7M5XEA0_9CNID